MPFVRSVLDVQLVQPVVCRVVPKWSPDVLSARSSVGEKGGLRLGKVPAVVA